ncbi:GNAT family N-acetyltransferase [Holzapfeliella floricola]|uniref:GNAT family N-acetyltransferase n=1 Tax=Holzapfeliella floricola TaxID=679249 RepID=UPI000780AFDC|nr:GNAT family N-acetyltransferase [Holzapfeliella floricola]
MQLKTIDYGSDRYQETLDLRNRVMKQPLNLDIRDEDLSGEESGYVVGAFNGEQLLGMGSLSYVNEKRAKVDYLCVDTEIQASGVGSNLLMAMETEARYQKKS